MELTGYIQREREIPNKKDKYIPNAYILDKYISIYS